MQSLRLRPLSLGVPRPLQVGSIYEFANKNPIFGVIEADSPLYAPILGFFMVTGFPTAGASVCCAGSLGGRVGTCLSRTHKGVGVITWERMGGG